MECTACNGLLYKDDDTYTCWNCGRHAYPLRRKVGITCGSKGKRRSHGGRQSFENIERQIIESSPLL